MINKKPIIIANWKMKLTPSKTFSIAKSLVKNSTKYNKVDLVLCPSFSEISELAKIIDKTKIKLGAQDCFWERSGAYTGEVSPENLKEYGVDCAIVGHSERRQFLGETNEMVNKKIKSVLGVGVVPVLCVNESFEERQEGEKDNIIARSVREALADVWLNKLNRLIVAYEPVWAIGSGQVPDPEEVEHTNRVIKHTLYDILPQDMVDNQVKVIYGGSVDPDNVESFLKQPTIDGALVGTASLKADVFTALIAVANKLTT